MDKPRFRFTLMPALLALLAGVLQLRPLNIVRVNAREVGHGHIDPRKHRVGAALLSLADAARERLARWSARYRAANRQTVFRVGATAATLTLAVLLDARALLAAPLALGAALSEGRHAGEFMLGERPDGGSRDNITVLSGQNLTAGAVVGRVNKGIGRAVSAAGANTGNGTLTGLSVSPDVQVGTYTLTCTAAATNAGTFSVTCPDGTVLPSATVAVAYTSRHLNFTLNDGSTDFIVGDSFTVVVSTTAPVVSGTGNGTISALSLGPDARPGRYRFVCTATATNGGTFTVTGPDGDVLGIFVLTAGAGTASAFTTRQINFTITDGGTDFAANDAFEVVVFNQLAGGKVVAWDPTTFDGRDEVAGILLDAVNASSGDLAGVILARDAAVIKGSLEWAAAITSAQKASAYLELAKLGIIAR